MWPKLASDPTKRTWWGLQCSWSVRISAGVKGLIALPITGMPAETEDVLDVELELVDLPVRQPLDQRP